MKYRISILFVVMAALIACSDQGKQEPVQDKPAVSKNIVTVKPPSSNADTMVVSQMTAVFYYPDSLQELSIKAVTDSGVYKSTVHEMFYQMRYSKFFLEKYYPNIKIVESRSKRYLFFTKVGLAPECIDLNTKNDARGLFIFDGKQSPRLVDMTNVETELGFYLKSNKQ